MVLTPTDSPTPHELRLTPRRVLSGSARLLVQDAVPRPITITDISKGGMGLLAHESVREGDACTVAFDVGAQKEKKRINVWAKVAYCVSHGEQEFRVGVRFLDFDSYSKMLIDQLCESGDIQTGW